MNNQELIEEVKVGWILSEDSKTLVKTDYDIIPVNQHFAVQLKTGNYTVFKKTDRFDDEVIKQSESYQNTLQFLKSFSIRDKR